MNLLISMLFSSFILAQCNDSILTLTMEDSWGDGWNGNTFCINDECATLTSGSYGMEEFCINLDIENCL